MKTLLIDDMKNIRATKTARTFHDGLDALKEEQWDVLLLDHDLGWNGEGRERTGYDILCWLEEHPEYLPNEIQIVSMNPVGRKKMLELVDRLYPNRQFKFKMFPDDFMDDIIEADCASSELKFDISDEELQLILNGAGTIERCSNCGKELFSEREVAEDICFQCESEYDEGMMEDSWREREN